MLFLCCTSGCYFSVCSLFLGSLFQPPCRLHWVDFFRNWNIPLVCYSNIVDETFNNEIFQEIVHLLGYGCELKGIVSRDWEDLQNDFIGLITVEVFNVSASGFIFIFSSASSRIVMRLTICPNLIFQNGVLCTVLPQFLRADDVSFQFYDKTTRIFTYQCCLKGIFFY